MPLGSNNPLRGHFPMLTEQSRRKASFDPDRSVPVRFADGSTWYIPKPHWRHQAVFKDQKAVDTVKRFGYSDDLDALVDALATEGIEDAAVMSIVATVAGALLRQNYELTDGELD